MEKITREFQIIKKFEDDVNEMYLQDEKNRSTFKKDFFYKKTEEYANYVYALEEKDLQTQKELNLVELPEIFSNPKSLNNFFLNKWHYLGTKTWGIYAKWNIQYIYVVASLQQIIINPNDLEKCFNNLKDHINICNKYQISTNFLVGIRYDVAKFTI